MQQSASGRMSTRGWRAWPGPVNRCGNTSSTFRVACAIAGNSILWLGGGIAAASLSRLLTLIERHRSIAQIKQSIALPSTRRCAVPP